MAEQFPSTFYAQGDSLFAKFFQHYVDWKHVHTCKDYLPLKDYLKKERRAHYIRSLMLKLD